MLETSFYILYGHLVSYCRYVRSTKASLLHALFQVIPQEPKNLIKGIQMDKNFGFARVVQREENQTR